MQFPRTPQAVIFDMDGLLIDTIPIYIAAMTEAGAQVGHPLSREYLVSLIGLLGQELHHRLIQDFGPDFPAEALLNLTGQRLTKIFGQGAPLKAGAAELVEMLHSRKMPLAVATSMKTAEAEHQLEMAGLRHCFVTVVGRDQVKNNKPHPDVYLEAASRLQVAPGICVALEDSLNGIRAAHSAGCITIMVPDVVVPTAESEALCVGVARDLFEVKALFEAGSPTEERRVNINIRNFASTDAEAVYAVAMAAWKFTYRDIYDVAFIENFVDTNYAPERLRPLAALVEEDRIFFAVAEQDGAVIGFCNIGRTSQGAELFRIYLRPDYLGRGIGKDLLAQGEHYVQGQGFTTYSCYVHSANEIGKRFYARQGFQHVAERDHDGEWCMEKQLG